MSTEPTLPERFVKAAAEAIAHQVNDLETALWAAEGAAAAVAVLELLAELNEALRTDVGAAEAHELRDLAEQIRNLS